MCSFLIYGYTNIETGPNTENTSTDPAAVCRMTSVMSLKDVWQEKAIELPNVVKLMMENGPRQGPLAQSIALNNQIVLIVATKESAASLLEALNQSDNSLVALVRSYVSHARFSKTDVLDELEKAIKKGRVYSLQERTKASSKLGVSIFDKLREFDIDTKQLGQKMASILAMTSEQQNKLTNLVLQYYDSAALFLLFMTDVLHKNAKVLEQALGNTTVFDKAYRELVLAGIASSNIGEMLMAAMPQDMETMEETGLGIFDWTESRFNGTLLEKMAKEKKLYTFRTLVENSEFYDMLMKRDKKFTVFALKNDRFPLGVPAPLLGNRAKIGQFISHYIVRDEINLTKLKLGESMSARTVAGDTILAVRERMTVLKVNGVTVTKWWPTKNGWLYVIEEPFRETVPLIAGMFPSSVSSIVSEAWKLK